MVSSLSTSVAELRIRLRGVMTALVTPFRPDLSLDLGALRQHVEYQIGAGVQTLVVGGTIGESHALSCAERMDLARTVTEVAAGRAVVIVGVASERPAVTKALAEQAREIGADGLLVSLPAHFKLTDAEQLDFFTWIDGAAGLPWTLYAAAGVASGPPTPSLLEQVAMMHWFAAYKEPRPDLARTHQLIRHFGSDLPLIAAAEIALPQMLLAGAVGAMTASACFAPRLVAQLVQGVADRDLNVVLAAFEPILGFRALFQQSMANGFPSYLPYTKAACEVVGLPSGVPRPPLRALDSRERDLVAAAVLGMPTVAQISGPSATAPASFEET